MSLFDLLAKTGDKVKGLGNNLYNRIRNTEVQPITLNQLSEDGGVDIDATMRVLDQTTPLTLGERFTGRTLTKDFQKIDPKTGKAEMTTVTSVRPGLLNDISSGYQENRFNPVSIENLKQNTLDNGREKGFAYRLGEGLGSLARLGNSPLGRGLLVGGIVGASGGNGLEALTYGAGTTMLNQGNVLRDQLYREALKRQGVDVSKIGGLVTDDMFRNYSLNNYRFSNLENREKIATMKDNTSRAKYILDALNNGTMSPETASQLISQYGITNADLQVSDKTRATDSKIKLDEIRGETAKVNAAANKTRADSYAKVNNAILGEDGGTVTTVRVISPDGKIGTIPAANLENAKKAGYREL